jgi:hypothetical protein
MDKSRLVVPGQPVDATPWNQWIPQHFPMENCFVQLYPIRL